MSDFFAPDWGDFIEGTRKMAAYYDEAHHLVISGDDARGGVTGHNARYVLAFGMAGVIAAFVAIAIYAGFDRLQEKVSAVLAHNPSEVVRSFAPYASITLIGAIAASLLLGLWNYLAGRDDNASQSFMRFRVVTQFALICVIMAVLYVSA